MSETTESNAVDIDALLALNAAHERGDVSARP